MEVIEENLGEDDFLDDVAENENDELLGEDEDGEILGEDEDDEILGEDDDDVFDEEVFEDASDLEPDGDGNEDEFVNVNDYESILLHLSKEWVKAEVNHRVSHAGSEAFWKLGMEWFFKMFQTKATQRVTRKTPQFAHIRRQLYKDYVPPVKIELAYKNRDSGSITIVEDSVTRRNEFPTPEYQKLWEISTIEVIKNLVKVPLLLKLSSPNVILKKRYAKNKSK